MEIRFLVEILSILVFIIILGRGVGVLLPVPIHYLHVQGSAKFSFFGKIDHVFPETLEQKFYLLYLLVRQILNADFVRIYQFKSYHV